MNFDTKPAGGSDQKVDPKVMEFVQQQQIQQQVLEQVEKTTAKCWDLCNVSMKDRLDGRQETCLRNCSERYFDVQEYVATRYMQKLQQAAGSSFS